MSNYEKMAVRQRKWMLYLLAVLMLGAGFTPYKTVFLGLFLGTAISFYNLYLLQRKIDELSEAAEKEDEAKRGLGTISRFAAAALGVIIVLKYEEYFHIIAFIVGLMTYYLVIMIDFIFSNKNKKNEREG